MFHTLLIANRGEIACRIIQTAKKLGIKTVAVYSKVDAQAKHVQLADEAFLLGPAAAQASYLNQERLLAIAQQSGAQAIHPGYGFLSENADFAEACQRAGIRFIGPSATAMRAMGDKAAAKRHMAAIGLPLLAGYHGTNQERTFLHAEADRIGYPLLIKASAGGGGKAMRRVDSTEEFDRAFTACQREAEAYFGNTHLILEQYLTHPRHIEIQIFADTHGHIVHLFDRDCSIQRRYQKVLEEAPAPNLSDELRSKLSTAAISAAHAVNYVGAGTVEFIVSNQASNGASNTLQNADFYFMEMNTRLQVEHPVTEMITGLDLVEWQLRIAAGEALPRSQEQITQHGHALEVRIYAEDPKQDFLPSPGRLLHLACPEESQHVRIESGVRQGDDLSPHYDPLVAKLITWDSTRASALYRMQQALLEFQLFGPANNLEFLQGLITYPRFINAELHTGLIEDERAALFSEEKSPPHTIYFLVAMAELLQEKHSATMAAQNHPEPNSPWHHSNAWRANHTAHRQLHFSWNNARQHIETTVHIDYTQPVRLCIDQHICLAHGELSSKHQIRVSFNEQCYTATVLADQEKRYIHFHGQHWIIQRIEPNLPIGASTQENANLRAPMPGKIIALLVEPNTQLAAGTPLLILEAMKMEHTMTAPSCGRLVKFHYAIGDQVDEGAELLLFEAESTVVNP